LVDAKYVVVVVVPSWLGWIDDAVIEQSNELMPATDSKTPYIPKPL